MYMLVFECAHVSVCAFGDQKRELDPLGLEL